MKVAPEALLTHEERPILERWSRGRSTPARLVMGHANVQTTMQYYVALDVDEMADELWENHPAELGNISGNIGQKSAEGDGSPDAKNLSRAEVSYPK